MTFEPTNIKPLVNSTTTSSMTFEPININP
jgi:hypothetical protein